MKLDTAPVDQLNKWTFVIQLYTSREFDRSPVGDRMGHNSVMVLKKFDVTAGWSTFPVKSVSFHFLVVAKFLWCGDSWLKCISFRKYVFK